MSLPIKYSVLERFLRYVVIDTQSDPESKTYPSTEKQKDLGRVLVEELKLLGVADAELDEFCYIYGTIPANTDKKVPVICYCSHMDTSPDSSGTGVKPIVHRKYDGADIVLPDDPNVVIRLADHPDLAEQMGNDIVTASGATLLGADNKSGLAAIMNTVQFFMENPGVKHGTIKILFTPDEEIGRGVDKVDLKKLGADFCYTVDGERLGSLEDETFSADAVVITINGVSAHPGFAKGKMENAIKIAGDILARLPKNRLSPETTEGREGFVHPVMMSGNAEQATLRFIIRDFAVAGLKAHEAELEQIVKDVMANYPRSTYDWKLTEQYRNMKEVLDQHPQIVTHAVEAIKRASLQPHLSSIRGGTDGSRLSFMGLPSPNIFAGEHAFHSKQEWVSVQDMQKAVETLVHLAMVWEEKA
ncbi:MAG: peptidase T [Saprospiraceae bacterium]|nr:peptidase T [Saprospiraceae bacterium]